MDAKDIANIANMGLTAGFIGDVIFLNGTVAGNGPMVWTGLGILMASGIPTYRALKSLYPTSETIGNNYRGVNNG